MAPISAATASNCRRAELSGLGRLQSGEAIVTRLSPRLAGRGQLKTVSIVVRASGGKKASRGIKSLLSWSIVLFDGIRMTEQNRAQFEKFIRGIGVRQVRLACGLVLFTYLVSHFLNHALGNISMEALAAGVHYHTMFWQFRPVAVVFYGAALVHSGLGIWALSQRGQFRWKAIEPLQLVLGLSIPALIVAHIVGTRLGHALYGHERLYPQVLYG